MCETLQHLIILEYNFQTNMYIDGSYHKVVIFSYSLLLYKHKLVDFPRKTRKTRHSFALFLQERWIRVEWDFMISLLFRLHKKTWRRHQPRWDEIAERRPLDLVAAPTFPTLKKNSKKSENNLEKKNKILTTSKLKTILLK